MSFISANGFSLVELIVVIAILGILLTLAIPKKDISRFEINSSAQIVYSTFKKTRQKAIAESEDYIIHLLENNRLAIRKSSESDYYKFIDINEDINITCSQSGNEMKFTPIGTAISGSFTISNEKYSKRVVVVGNGYIHIE